MKNLVHTKIPVTLGLLLLALVACNKDDNDAEKKIKESNERLAAYITENNITVEPTASGLYFIEIQKGNGYMPKKGQRVQVHYTGTLLDGTKFDSSIDRNQPFSFTLGSGQVIAGWDEGLLMMEEGGKARLILPQHLGYKDKAMSGIPAYSPLIFDVELLKISN